MIGGKVLSAIIIAIILASLCGIVVIWLLTPIDRNEVYLEIIKTLLNLLVAGVIGSILSIIVRNYQRHQEKTDKELELRKSILEKIDKAYRDVKIVRRAIKSGALVAEHDSSSPTAVRVERYSEAMKELEDVQLELEDLVKDMEATKGVLPRAMDIRADIISIETYLRMLTREYENIMPRFTKEQNTIPLSQLENLQDFVGPFRQSRMRVELAQKYQSARSIALKGVLGIDGISVRK